MKYKLKLRWRLWRARRVLMRNDYCTKHLTPNTHEVEVDWGIFRKFCERCELYEKNKKRAELESAISLLRIRG